MLTLRNFGCSLAIVFSSALSLTAQVPISKSPSPDIGTLVRTPCDFGPKLLGEEGLIFVPENRAKKESRIIAVHFLRFPTSAKSKLPPVFVLPGGPGGYHDELSIRQRNRNPKLFNLVYEIRMYQQQRDVVIVNQRGNPKGPGLQTDFLAYRSTPLALDVPRSNLKRMELNSKQAKSAIDFWSAKGVDLAGYNIQNMLEDIEALRVSLGYDKIALRGTSFGSQWSLAYLKEHEQFVDREILAGVEPLDFAYDDPTGMWNVFARIEANIKKRGRVKLPKEGLLGAIKTVVARLEKTPVKVKVLAKGAKTSRSVAVGADDFRSFLLGGIKEHHKESLRARQFLPKLILEAHAGEYRYLAAKLIETRPVSYTRSLMPLLVDHSLGISLKRKEKIESNPAARWLGDINWNYNAMTKVAPTKPISDEFRKFSTIDVPVLMIHGDMDLSTPIENAEAQLKHLTNGHLIRVVGGTHGAVPEIGNTNPEFKKYLNDFMKADFQKIKMETLFEKTPSKMMIPEFPYGSYRGATLYEQYLGKKDPTDSK